MTRRHPTTLFLAAALIAGARLAAAADAPEATVSSMGVATVEKQPQFLRMNCDLQVEGPNLKDALARLKARREQLRTSLARLGAVEATIDLGEPKVVDANSGDRRDAMARMMRQRMASTKPAAGAAPAKTVTVYASIKCDWPLKGETTEESLIASTELQDKIKDAKLFDAPKSPARQEEEEEGAVDQSNDQGPRPGEPVFVYVAKISPAEEARAAADAFAKSKDAASRLAKAAGAALGTLKSLTSQSNDTGGFGDEDPYNRYNSYMQRYLMQMARQTPDASGDTESLSAQPGKIVHQVAVSTTFAIK